MSRFFLILLAVAVTAPASAQSSAETKTLPALFTSGTFGIGYVDGEHASELLTLDASLDLHRRRHAGGVRIRTHSPFFSIGASERVIEAGVVYSYSLTRSLSVGTGLLYINQIYHSREASGFIKSKRLGIPAEVVFRLRPLPQFGPYVRGMLTFSGAPPHGGISLGISF